MNNKQKALLIVATATSGFLAFKATAETTPEKVLDTVNFDTATGLDVATEFNKTFALSDWWANLFSDSTDNENESFNNHTSRGYRNNNPLNIRLTDIDWKGKIQNYKNTDGAFEQFTSAKYGFRAAIKNILNYNKNYGIKHLDEIIARWAPEVGKNPKDGSSYKNHTKEYIDFVSKSSGISKHGVINSSNVSALALAMAQFENLPPHPYSLAYVEEASKL